MRSNVSTKAWINIRKRVMIPEDTRPPAYSSNPYQMELRTIFKQNHRVDEE